MMQYFYLGAPYLIAIALGMAVIVAPFVLYLFTRGLSDTLKAIAVLWGIAVVAVLNVVLVPRSLALEEFRAQFNAAAYLQGAQSAGWVSRIVTLALVGLALSILLGGLLERHKRGKSDPLWSLGIAMVLFYVVNVLTGATLAGAPTFNHQGLYIPIILGAALLLTRAEWPVLVRQIKLILGLLMLANIVVAIVDPDFAMLRPYSGILPGIDFRLYGVTSQANTLGPVALLLLIFELYYPSRVWVRWPLLALGFINFMLAQSKTVWATAVLILLVCYLPYRFYQTRTEAQGDVVAMRLMLGLLAVVGVTGGLAAAVYHGLDAGLAQDITTFTGRTSIWEATLAEFSRNPLFGYGPSIWDVEYRYKLGFYAAGQAHNQFIQTLGESGLVGLVLMLGYLLILLRFSLRTFKASHGLSLALFTLLFVRTITEAPLRSGVTEWIFFIHVLAVTLIAYCIRKEAPEPVAERQMGSATRWKQAPL